MTARLKGKPNGFFSLFKILITILALAGILAPAPAYAQAGSEAWSTPVNISSSGTASSPILVRAGEGSYLALWLDETSGWMLSTGNGVEWTPPKAARNSFGELTPARVLSDPAGNIHAFLIDGNGNLSWSVVTAANLAAGANWSFPRRIATSALSLDAVADSTGRVHLAYVQNNDTSAGPAGVYYLMLRNARSSWSSPTPLYQSPYFRSLGAEQAWVRVAATDSGETQPVYVAWDNPARERVFVIASPDAGQTWGEAREVDSPSDTSLAGGPARISVGAQGAEVLLVWQSDRSGPNCSQYYQWSPDGGQTWGERLRMFEDLPGCPQLNQILPGTPGAEGSAGRLYLLSVIADQAYLLAWNGSQWSSPQLQASLTTITDPDTHRPVRISCLQALRSGDNLAALGCDPNGQDIWTTTRSLAGTDAWFTTNAVWAAPATVASSEFAPRSPVIIPDLENRIHILWSQPASSLPGSPGISLFYDRIENGRPLGPQSMLSSTTGVAEDPSGALSPDGRLMLVWSGGESGEIYFSSVEAARSGLSDSWSEPVLLPAVLRAGSSPHIRVDAQGVIYVVYAIPLNEQRGIYLTRSQDGGQTWSEPGLVFDAAAAGWAMVDHPILALTENGHLHLLWTRYSLPSGQGSLGLYYTRSADGGATWSQAETVSDTAVLWSQMTGSGERTVHRLWQEVSGGRLNLWHEFSQDSGVTWSRVSPVSIFGETVGSPAVAQDRAGRLHLLQLVKRTPGSYALQQWIWDGQSWMNEHSLDINDRTLNLTGDLAAAVSPSGVLAVTYSGIATDPLDGSVQEELFYVNRTLSLPEGLPTPLPPLPVTPQPSATPTLQAPAVTPTAPLSLPETGNGSGPGQSGVGTVWIGSIVGLFVAAFIVIGVTISAMRRGGVGRR